MHLTNDFLSSFPFLQKVEDFSVILGSVDKSDLTNMYLKFEIAIIKQVYLIAMEFAEFMQLGLSIKVSISCHKFSMKSEKAIPQTIFQSMNYISSTGEDNRRK